MGHLAVDQYKICHRHKESFCNTSGTCHLLGLRFRLVVSKEKKQSKLLCKDTCQRFKYIHEVFQAVYED